jgi:hypothetical protein
MKVKYLDMLINVVEQDYRNVNSSDNKNKISLLNSLIKKFKLTNNNVIDEFKDPEGLKKKLLKHYSSGSIYSITCRFDSIVEKLNLLIEPNFKDLSSLAFALLKYGRLKYGQDNKITTIANLITADMKVNIGKKTLGKWMRGSMSITSNIENVNRLNEIETILNLEHDSLVNAAAISSAYVKVINRTKKARSELKGLPWENIPTRLKEEFNQFVNFKTEGEVCLVKKELGRKRSSKILKGENTWSKRDDGHNGSAYIFKTHISSFIGFLINHNNVDIESVTSLSILLNWDYLEDFFNFRVLQGEGYANTARFFSTLTSNCYKNGYFELLAPPLDEALWKDADINTWEDYVKDLNENFLIPKSKELDKLHNSNKAPEEGALSNVLHMLPGNGKTFEDTVRISNGIIQFMEQRLTSLTAPLYRMTKSRSITFLRIALYRPLRVINFCKLKLVHHYNELKSSESTISFNIDQNCWQINIPKQAFKNRGGKSCKPLNYLLSSKLNNHIDAYLKIRSDYLTHIGQSSDSFFIDQSGKQAACNALGNMLKEHTLEAIVSYYESKDIKYSKFISGINAHATRHITASIYLDKNAGDVVGAALLLNDDIKTVIETYIQTDTQRYQEKANQLFDSLYD